MALELKSPLLPRDPLLLFISLAFGVAFAVVVTLRLLQSLRKPSATSQPYRLLLTGPSGGGKTALFSKLAFGYAPPCCLSLKDNETIINLDAEKGYGPEMKVVDLPGHPRLRSRYLATHVPLATACVFVVNGCGGLTGKGLREAAEHLHILMAFLQAHSEQTGKGLLPILIYLAKADLLLARDSGNASNTSGASRVQTALERAKASLEREIDRRRRITASAASPNAGGAKIEGLDDIPSSQRTMSYFLTFKRWLGRSSAESYPAVQLPADETNILNNFGLAGEGDGNMFSFDQSGYHIQWAAGTVADDLGSLSSGSDQVLKWLNATN